MSDTTTVTQSSSNSAACVCEPAPARQQVRSERFARPRYTVQNGEAAYIVEVDVPGVEKAGLEIAVEEGVLQIVGHRDWTVPEGWRPIGQAASESFDYRLRLAVGEDVDREGIGAQLSNGVLRLSLPKAAEKQPRRIEVK